MAHRTIGWKAGGYVIGICSSSEVCLVARIAGRWSRSVIVVCVALSAGHSCVHACQRVIRKDGMIKRDVGPVRRGMACITGSRKSRGDVIGIRGPIEIRLVAAVAGGRQRRVVVVGVALRARNSRMRSRQRERGRVIESGRGPAAGRVAQGTIRGEAGRNMIWICGPGKIRLVARVAGRRR